ncbi:MAG: hypothetical protein QX198_18110 [Methylococcaceae bacterium]
MTIESSAMTNAEYYNLNGTLSDERIERLLDVEDLMEVVDPENLVTQLEEVTNAFPNEEFAEDLIYELYNLAPELADNHAKTLYSILERLEHRIQATMNDANYGIDILQELISELS